MYINTKILAKELIEGDRLDLAGTVYHVKTNNPNQMGGVVIVLWRPHARDPHQTITIVMDPTTIVELYFID